MNELLALDGGNESDAQEDQDKVAAPVEETRRTFERTARHDQSAVLDSSHSSGEHVLGRSDVEEVQNLVKKREQQVININSLLRRY